MNKDNFIASVRALKDYFDTNYSYSGPTLSDCTVLNVGHVIIKFNGVINLVCGHHDKMYTYEEFEEAYSFLLFCLYGSVTRLQGDVITFSCIPARTRNLKVIERDNEVIMDVSGEFSRLHEAYKYFKYFLPTIALIDGQLSESVSLVHVPFTFKIYYKASNEPN